jgi:hypothetical protein
MLARSLPEVSKSERLLSSELSSKQRFSVSMTTNSA